MKWTGKGWVKAKLLLMPASHFPERLEATRRMISRTLGLFGSQQLLLNVVLGRKQLGSYGILMKQVIRIYGLHQASRAISINDYFPQASKVVLSDVSLGFRNTHYQ